MAKLNLSNIGPMSNLIINGDFSIWQRAVVFTTAVNGGFTADRWEYQQNGTAVHSIGQSIYKPTFAQSGHTSTKSLYLLNTTVDAALAATDYTCMLYRPEGLDIKDLIGGYATLSFWTYALTAETYCVAIYNIASAKTYLAEYTCAAETWEKQTVTFDLPSTDTWNVDTSQGFTIYFTVRAGTTYQGTANQWNAGIKLGTANIDNFDATDSNTLRLSQVKLEAGQTATPFRARLHATELALCQRYYEKTYLQSVKPGTVSTTGQLTAFSPQTLGANYPFVTCTFQTQKRAAPTVTMYSPSDGESGHVRNLTDGANYTALGYLPSEHQFHVLLTEVGTAAGELLSAHWVADAEL